MRKYTAGHRLDKIFCNKCGKELKIDREIPMEGVLTVRKEWEYFSEKDGQIDTFDLCETCYDAWTKTFAIPVDTEENTELLGV